MTTTRIKTRGRRGQRDVLLSLLASGRIDRREFLRRFGAGGVLLLGGPALLAACGGEGGAGTTGTNGGGALVVDNWIEYIDISEDGQSYPTIEKFTAETGIEVTYTEGVNSNEEWFGKYQQQLAAGQPIGIDMTMLTDHFAARMIRLGYLEQIDKANVPNAGNLVAGLQSPAFDPTRDYTLPWQSFFTGIGYDIDQTGREITSLQDLLDPEFAGKVGLLEGYDDTLVLFLLMEGKDPETASVQDYVDVSQKVKDAIDSGQIRDIYGNDYLDALQTGDLAISLAYSGDVVANQADFPSLRFAFPEEGFRIGTDNMMIIKGAANKANAEAWMDFYYRPEIAAELAAYILFMSPVEGAKEAAAEIDPALAEEPLVFPSDEVLDNAFLAKAFTEEEEQTVTEAFAAAVGL
ncbi:MAG TPA: spermidine/putrescine ABC transporter substrate-binding protein [Acidimicrobiia bacterium]|nr:spermidine/putrescine ABC transporter substrate-binding protein [Acidimicrobiia bacterium]